MYISNLPLIRFPPWSHKKKKEMENSVPPWLVSPSGDVKKSNVPGHYLRKYGRLNIPLNILHNTAFGFSNLHDQFYFTLLGPFAFFLATALFWVKTAIVKKSTKRVKNKVSFSFSISQPILVHQAKFKYSWNSSEISDQMSPTEAQNLKKIKNTRSNFSLLRAPKKG